MPLLFQKKIEIFERSHVKEILLGRSLDFPSSSISQSLPCLIVFRTEIVSETTFPYPLRNRKLGAKFTLNA